MAWHGRTAGRRGKVREGWSLAEAGSGSPRGKAWPGGGSAFRQAGTGESGPLAHAHYLVS